MKIIQSTHLTATQQADLAHLERICKEQEPMFLSFPIEDDIIYFLRYQEEQLISAIAFFFPTILLCECIAMTLPTNRQQGHFSALFNHALDYLEQHEEEHSCDTVLYFLTDEAVSSAKKTLAALEADYIYSEYKMELDLIQFTTPANQSMQILVDDNSLRSAECCGDSPSLWSAECCGDSPSLWSAECCGDSLSFRSAECSCQFIYQHQLVGRCQLLVWPSSIYLHDFEIIKSYRNQGYGKIALAGLIQRFRETKTPTLTLQVSSDNPVALSLYQKTGFQITETLSYYQY